MNSASSLVDNYVAGIKEDMSPTMIDMGGGFIGFVTKGMADKLVALGEGKIVPQRESVLGYERPT